MYQAINQNGKNSVRGGFRYLGLSADNNFFNENLIQYLYNRNMEEKKFVFGIIENLEFLTSVRDAFDFGNKQQQAFIRNVYDAIIRSIPDEKTFLFEDYSFDACQAEDDSVLIEFITPELYFSVDIEEKTINSSWTFSLKKNDGTRLTSGGFFNDKFTIQFVIRSVCRQIIQWMEYGWIS